MDRGLSGGGLTWKVPSSLTYSVILSRMDETRSSLDGGMICKASEVVSRSSGKWPPGMRAGTSPSRDG